MTLKLKIVTIHILIKFVMSALRLKKTRKKT